VIEGMGPPDGNHAGWAAYEQISPHRHQDPGSFPV
jgi:hypothetical protein